MGRGTIDFCPVFPRELVKRCLQLNSAAIILAHQHPNVAERSSAKSGTSGSGE